MLKSLFLLVLFCFLDGFAMVWDGFLFCFVIFSRLLAGQAPSHSYVEAGSMAWAGPPIVDDFLLLFMVLLWF